LALLADICVRNLQPAGLFAFSPWTDLAMTGESLHSNAKADPLLPRARIAEALGYVHGALAVTDPRISPLYADFPRVSPVLIQVSTTEVLRDDSGRMAARLRAAGGVVTLSEWKDAPHVWQMFDGYIPEARAALREVTRFVQAVL
jgi:monoterpene epsilon-lactone hydrolase